MERKRNQQYWKWSGDFFIDFDHCNIDFCFFCEGLGSEPYYWPYAIAIKSGRGIRKCRRKGWWRSNANTRDRGREVGAEA